MRKDCVEGNISWFPERQFTLADLVRKHKPRKILEVGFNMGHSMLLICQQLVEIIKEDKTFNIEPIQIYVLDIGEHDCVTNNFDILQKHFFGWNIHLFLIKGDSNFTLPRFLNEYDDNFDFVEIDGCHTYDCAKKDIENVLNRIAPNGLIYVDDFASTKAPIPDVDNAIKDIDWNNFDTYNIDGVFWGNRKVSQVFDKNDLVTNITEETSQPLNKEQVNHPQHYGGESNVYEAIKVIDAWDLGFSLGNTVKYISRAGKKNKEKELEDLKKALWYLQHHIETLEKK